MIKRHRHLIDWRASVHGAEMELLLIALLDRGPKTLLQAPRGAWEGVAGGMMPPPPQTPYPGTCEVTFSGHAGFADGMEV